jgi:ceramide glucosyltransferase
MAPFDDPGVGAVTCLYKATAMGGLGSRLGAMFVNDWFLPSALVSAGFRSLRYCFGATMALRRGALEAMGGFESLVDYLADDYMLGHRVIAQGYRIVLADCVVENLIEEPGFGALVRHELRWARTMRRVEPVGYALAALTDVVPVTALSGIIVYLSGGAAWAALGLAGLGLLARALLHLCVVRELGIRQGSSVWLIPVRDLLTALLRVWSFIPGPVTWRGHEFDVDVQGRLTLRSGNRSSR